MTHTTPIAATSASPPPCGEVLGVGGRRRPTGLALALTIALTTPTQAQIIPTGSPAADILLTQALAEHRVFLTCSSLDGVTYPIIVKNWQRDVDAAAASLTANNVAAEVIAAFTTAAKPANLLPAPDTPYEDVLQICAAQPNWQESYGLLNITILELKLPRVFE